MWHYVVIEIERKRIFLKESFSVTINPEILDRYKASEVDTEQVPAWNILYKAPIEERRVGDDELEQVVFNACQVWLEQNKVQGSKYAIMKVFIV